jgi:hypothetical protein
MNNLEFLQCIFSSSSYVSKTRLLMMTGIFIMFILFGNLCYRMINSNPHFPLHRIQVIHTMGCVESKKWWVQGDGSVSCFCLDKSRQRHLASFVLSLNPGIFNKLWDFHRNWPGNTKHERMEQQSTAHPIAKFIEDEKVNSALRNNHSRYFQ